MKYRNALPQLAGKFMITDGGLETFMIFKQGLNLPLFASFKALETHAGIGALDAYMQRFADLAVSERRGFVMDTPTWRASARWAAELGVCQDSLRAIHRDAICTLSSLRTDKEVEGQSTFVINGVIGPQDDGYAPARSLTVDQAEAYHAVQVGWFEEFGANMVSAVTMTYTAEAIGIARAAKACGIPVAISFTLDTDGVLPSGETLQAAIEAVDAATEASPAYYMMNCTHPDHFRAVLAQGGDWTTRIQAVRANASRLCHAELVAAGTLDEGDPTEFGQLHRDMYELLPNLTVLGGCCGTDHRHIEKLCAATRAT